MLTAIKTALPWWFKIGSKLVLSRVPIAYGFWQRLGLFRHGHMDTAEYSLGVFDAHVSRAGLSGSGLRGKVVLEMGPGDSVATAIIASAYGAKAVLIDTGDYAAGDMRTYRAIYDLLKNRGLKPPNILGASNIGELLQICDAQYLSNGMDDWQRVPSASVDLLFSQAVLEHVRKNEFATTQKECFRVLKPNAVASHRVDLRDHLGGSLNNLRFREQIWESGLFARSGFYTNRIRFSDMVESFRSVGFIVELGEVRRWEKLPTPKAKLSSEFRDVSESELCVSGFDVLLRKNLAQLS